MKWLGCLYLGAAALPQLFARKHGDCAAENIMQPQPGPVEWNWQRRDQPLRRCAWRGMRAGAQFLAAAGVAAAARMPAPPEI